MKTSLYIPLHLVLDDLSKTGDSLAAIGRAAEDAGFDACNLTDHPAPTAKWRHSGGHDALDPFAALCFIAAATRRIRLHTHIVVLPYRNPFVTAKCITTLDVVSNGRAIIGVGAGYMKGEYFALDMDYDTRGPAMDPSRKSDRHRGFRRFAEVIQGASGALSGPGRALRAAAGGKGLSFRAEFGYGPVSGGSTPLEESRLVQLWR